MRRPKMGALGSMALALLLLAAQPVREGRYGCRARWFVRDGTRIPLKSDSLRFQGAERHGASCEAIHHIRDRRVLTSVKFPARPAASSVLTAVPSLSRDLNGSAPLQRHADISGQPSGILDDFDPELVSARTEVLRPKDIDLLWHAGQRVFPPRLLLNDGAALVRAQLVRKTVHLYLGAAVAYRALDDRNRAPNGLFIGKPRWLRKLIVQCLFLSLRRRPLCRFLGRLFRLG